MMVADLGLLRNTNRSKSIKEYNPCDTLEYNTCDTFIEYCLEKQVIDLSCLGMMSQPLNLIVARLRMRVRLPKLERRDWGGEEQTKRRYSR
jgi:hypothetical protein